MNNDDLSDLLNSGNLEALQPLDQIRIALQWANILLQQEQSTQGDRERAIRLLANAELHLGAIQQAEEGRQRGRQSRSEAKQGAARENGRRGGRPRKTPEVIREMAHP